MENQSCAGGGFLRAFRHKLPRTHQLGFHHQQQPYEGPRQPRKKCQDGETSCFRSSNERKARAVSLTRGREELPRVERLAMTRGGKTSFPAPLAMIKSQARQGGRTAFLPYHSRPSLTLPLLKSARLDVLLVGIGLFRQLINNIAPERCIPLPPVSPWIISRIRSLTLGITSKVNNPRIAISRILDC